MSSNDFPEGDNVSEPQNSSVSTHELGSPEQRISEARKQSGIALEQVRDDEQRSVVRHQIADAEAKLQRALDQLEAIAEEADA